MAQKKMQGVKVNGNDMRNGSIFSSLLLLQGTQEEHGGLQDYCYT